MKRVVLTSRSEPSDRNSGTNTEQETGKSGNRRDLFGRRDAGETRREAYRPPIEVTVEPDVDEPTWEVRRPGRGRGRLDARTRSILSAAAVAAIVVNAGAAWAYWKVTASETGNARAGTAVELTLRGRSDYNRPLAPGGTGNLTVTLTNDNDFPIRITSVSPGPGNVVADDEHRDAGCRENIRVSLTKSAFAVSWNVAKNTIGAFSIPDGLRMDPTSNKACQGATFTVPVLVSGVSGG